MIPIFLLKTNHCSFKLNALQMRTSEVFFKIKLFYFWILWPNKHFLIIKINNFWGDLSSISAKTATLMWTLPWFGAVQGYALVMPYGSFQSCWSCVLIASFKLIAMQMRTLPWFGAMQGYALVMPYGSFSCDDEPTAIIAITEGGMLCIHDLKKDDQKVFALEFQVRSYS